MKVKNPVSQNIYIWVALNDHPYSINSEYLLFFETTIMEKTADFASKCFADQYITVLDWPANMPDLNPIWNLWDIFKRKMRTSWSNNTDKLKTQ